MLEPPSHVPPASQASYPVRSGNRVRPLIGGEAAFRRISEAVEAAKHSVWLTVAFIAPDFELPDGRGSLFDLLDRATARGLDVRALFWRPNPELACYEANTFSGTQAQRDLLAARGSRYRIRWDRAFGSCAQHSKSWLVDAGEAGETVFVGGMNLNPRALGSRDHGAGGAWHDLYLELTGPSASDVHHSFVQRWNEASERRSPDGVWGHDGDDALAFPVATSLPAGDSVAQVQRTVHPGLYNDGCPAPDAAPFFIASGERSILEQYLRAIAAAGRTIYIENQALTVRVVVEALEAALRRGVAVVALLPAEPEAELTDMRRHPAHRVLFERLAGLAAHERFLLAGLAPPDRAGGRQPLHVHAKAMLVDDVWATVGSCNLHAYSLFGSTEVNVSFWDPAAVRDLRVALLAKHLETDTGGLDDEAALALYRRVARENRRRREAGNRLWQGDAFALDPATYGA